MKAVVTMGLPGAGKTTAMKAMFDLTEWVMIDPDAIKESHPDYDPKDPEALHEWSKAKANATMYEAIAEQQPLIIDGTATNSDKMISVINKLHEAGYEVTLIYVKVSVATSLARNASRERTVPNRVIREKAGLMAISFEAVSGYVDHVKVVNND